MPMITLVLAPRLQWRWCFQASYPLCTIICFNEKRPLALEVMKKLFWRPKSHDTHHGGVKTSSAGRDRCSISISQTYKLFGSSRNQYIEFLEEKTLVSHYGTCNSDYYRHSTTFPPQIEKQFIKLNFSRCCTFLAYQCPSINPDPNELSKLYVAVIE